MSVLTGILLKPAVNTSNRPESKEQERKEGKEEGERNEHAYVLISSTSEINEKV